MKAGTTSSAQRLLLFGTEGCHLCELAEQLMKSEPAVDYELIDIAEDPALQARYGVRIPVLSAPGIDHELDWPFDRTQLIAYLSGVMDPAGRCDRA